MFRETDLQELVEFDGHNSPVVSLYLNVDPRQRTTEEYKLALRRLLDAAVIPTPDRERIERYVELEYDRQARGLVCFSCQEKGFWRAYTFQVPLEDAIMVDRRPLVRRLVEMIDTYGHLGVVAVDRQGARFFSFHLGVLEEATGMVGEEVRRHKQGGWAAQRYQRHEDETALANLREAVEQTERLARQYNWRRLVLAGTDANVARFQELLPTSLQKLVVGTMPLELNASIQEVRDRAEAVALQARSASILQLAADLVVAAAKGNNAVLGLGPTVEAIQSGRVYHLLFTEDYEVEEGRVRRCEHCGYLGTGDEEACPLCGGEYRPLPDAINTLARRTLVQGAQVTVLPPDNPLMAAGHPIGAFLRF
ncbi:MAG: Vms1/Ankzf1 family peptidyl-tRNA hydrolase [Anaerolineae bacterium]|nr:Vms1/Ankzf1 family peptidyl-tRNA hydrolase [Caldilineales bacterium]MCX7853295.1 Vms1/Ankzf1 family peptidyl-tRNA hydrolase [Caldilineales bacterium]MDW8268508.1 Vms1/Ankzf1 family peptidyl-tRNA hydrolase [Anaerolineae bacterium]